MRKLLLAGIAAAAIAHGPVARAQSFYCINCSQWQQQIVDAANQVRQLETQIQQLQTEIGFWTTLVQNTISLPERIFSDVSGTISGIENMGEQISHFSDQAKFMISNLGHPGQYGGSLADIPGALVQEDNALAAAMQRLGVVNDQTRPLNQQYTAKLASLEGTSASGTTQAIQVGNSITATIGQQHAAQADVTNSALQTLAMAEIRKADRESMIAQQVRVYRANAIEASCQSLTVISAPICRSFAGAPGYVAPAASGAPIPSGGNISDASAFSINAAANTP